MGDFFRTLDAGIFRNYTRKGMDFGNSYVFGAYEGEQLIGLGHLDRYQKPEKAHVLDLGIVVHQDWQRRGVGWALMLQLLAEARKRGTEKINLRVFYDNKPAVNLYRKLGFEVEGTFVKEEKWNGKYRTILSMAVFL